MLFVIVGGKEREEGEKGKEKKKKQNIIQRD